jgi:alkyl sulfatase BDS1-like metallo-beta-lactamase superfamily hydrolase
MGKVRDLAERLWNGPADPLIGMPRAETALESAINADVVLEEYAPRLAFVSAFSNVLAIETGDGLLLLDTSSRIHADRVYAQIRGWSKSRLNTALYTHGHVDHVFGTHLFEKEAAASGDPRPTVVAHENCPPRFERYQLTNGYNGHINMRQFSLPMPIFPMKFRHPDELVGNRRTLRVGDVTIELAHDKGETDDHLWAWIPEARAIYSGDLFIWASPNCGNPQKVQRYPREWAAALRKMASLEAEMLFPGHGPPITGAARVRQALEETAELLETLVEQTLSLMNQGARLDEVVHSVSAPERLLARPYLRPVYDEPEFVVRNLWRLYGGWYDGNPAELKPAKEADLAREIASLTGGTARLVKRAEELASAGEWRLACHLVETAALAAPDDARVHRVRADLYSRRVEHETSLMAKGIFVAAARESRSKGEAS